jgi:hypothetical protein
METASRVSQPIDDSGLISAYSPTVLTRRQFLRQAAVGGAALLLAPHARPGGAENTIEILVDEPIGTISLRARPCFLRGPVPRVTRKPISGNRPHPRGSGRI